MANDNENDTDFTYEDWLAEVSPMEKAQGAVALAEQMRKEEDMLGQQTAEEARLEQAWRQGPTSGVMAPGMSPAVPATPGPAQYGQVMPTSRGFMYVGNPIPGSVAPPMPTDRDVWQSQVQQSVADTGNIPLPEPAGGWYGPSSVFQPNTPSIAQQQYDMTQRYLAEQNPMVKAQHLSALMALTGRGRTSPVADQLRLQQEERLKGKEARIAAQIPSYVTRARSSLQSQLDRLTQQRIAALGGDNPDMVKALDNEIKSKQADLNDLDSKWMPGGRTAPVATPAPVAPLKTTISSGRVRVRNPQGKVGTIPVDQLDDALAAGWKRL